MKSAVAVWFKLYFICIIYDKYTNNTEYDYNTTTIQMGFRRKSNDLFESVSQEFTLLIYVLSCRNYTPPHFSVGVLCYTFRCLSVRPSVRPCSPFSIDNLIIYSRNFFKFCIHIVIGDEWYGIVNGQNPSIFNGVTALFRIGKMVSNLLFLYCSCYLNETSQICCTSKVTYCD